MGRGPLWASLLALRLHRAIVIRRESWMVPQGTPTRVPATHPHPPASLRTGDAPFDWRTSSGGSGVQATASKKGKPSVILQQDSPEKREEIQAADVEENAQQPHEAGTCPVEPAFRPLTRVEQRNLWMKAFGEQDVALHMWTRLVEQQDLEIEMLLQMRGLLVFGVMVSTQQYAQYYIDLNEDLHREREPETADALRNYYLALVPPQDQPAIGPEGLPIISRYIHMRDVTIMNAGQKIQVPYWRGKLSEVDAFVMGATVPE